MDWPTLASGGEIVENAIHYSCLSTVATNLLADAFNARDSLRILPSVADFSPFSAFGKRAKQATSELVFEKESPPAD